MVNEEEKEHLVRMLGRCFLVVCSKHMAGPSIQHAFVSWSIDSIWREAHDRVSLWVLL